MNRRGFLSKVVEVGAGLATVPISTKDKEHNKVEQESFNLKGIEDLGSWLITFAYCPGNTEEYADGVCKIHALLEEQAMRRILSYVETRGKTIYCVVLEYLGLLAKEGKWYYQSRIDIYTEPNLCCHNNHYLEYYNSFWYDKKVPVFKVSPSSYRDAFFRGAMTLIYETDCFHSAKRVFSDELKELFRGYDKGYDKGRDNKKIL